MCGPLAGGGRDERSRQGRAGENTDGAEERASEAIPAPLRIRKRALAVYGRRAGDRRGVGASAQGRRARLAYDPRRPHAGTDVSPSHAAEGGGRCGHGGGGGVSRGSVVFAGVGWVWRS